MSCLSAELLGIEMRHSMRVDGQEEGQDDDQKIEPDEHDIERLRRIRFLPEPPDDQYSNMSQSA
jgi:hypothetical protein